MTALPITLAVFVGILVLARLKVPLSLSIVIGTAGMGLAFGLGAAEVGRTILLGVVRPRTIGMGVLVVFLLSLCSAMQVSGQMDRIVSLSKAMLRRPILAMAALPSLIGLLPMPGGALFSAPMVESAAKGTAVPGGRLSAINYWFRHIWEHWWPLYPGVLLAAMLTESDLGTFIAFQIPLGLFAVSSGLLIFRGIHPDLHIASPPAAPGTKRSLVLATSSIWVALAVWGVATAAVKLLLGGDGAVSGPGPVDPDQVALATARKFAPITVGLIVSLVWTVRVNRIDRPAIRKIFARKGMYDLILLIVSIMVIQFMLERVDAAAGVARELAELRVPIVLVVIMLPLMAGITTGLAVGFVGASFPIVIALVQALPEGTPMRPYLVLAYASGHLGQMLSPLHVCHVVSNRYFKTSYGPVYRRIVPSAILMAALSFAYFLALRAAMN